MLKIAKSLITIAAVAAIAVGATGAYFSSTATITDNTFSTGTLDIRVNGEPSVVGATFSPVAPGEVVNSPEYQINNYGQPYFAGSSNLTAKKLILNIQNVQSSGNFNPALWNEAKIKVEVNRGWPDWQVAYNGYINGLNNVDLLAPNWTELIPGSSESFRYQIWVPNYDEDQSALMGQTIEWDFAIEGRTS